MNTTATTVGTLLRDWRRRRRMSQLDLACEADISQRHLSFVESGRSRPSREMLLHLAERLGIPLRERNSLLLAAGLAPVYAERSLDDPALAAARQAVDLVLKGHEPYPAIAVDRYWNLVAANAVVPKLLAGVKNPAMLEPPVNVMRLSLHPDGLAERIVNIGEWREHLLLRLREQVNTAADTQLAELLTELEDYPVPRQSSSDTPPAPDYGGVVVPMRFELQGRVLSFFSTITVFGTPTDVTLSELALECFYPADEATAQAMWAAQER